MSSQSQVSVANISLLSLGVQQQTSSIFPSDGSAQANAINTLYSFVFQQIARAAKWGCLKKQLPLTLLQAAQGYSEKPHGSFHFLYHNSHGCMRIYTPQIVCLCGRYLAPAFTTGGSEPQTTISNSVTPWIPGQYTIPYETGYSTDSFGNPIEVILTNQEHEAIANYTVDQQNPQSWDSLFTSAYCASLAAYLVPALSLDKGLMQMQIALAEKMIMTARAMDGNESPTSQDHIPDWIRARSGASGCYNYQGLNGYNGYGVMAWPSWGRIASGIPYNPELIC